MAYYISSDNKPPNMFVCDCEQQEMINGLQHNEFDRQELLLFVLCVCVCDVITLPRNVSRLKHTHCAIWSQIWPRKMIFGVLVIRCCFIQTNETNCLDFAECYNMDCPKFGRPSTVCAGCSGGDLWTLVFSEPTKIVTIKFTIHQFWA